MVEGTRALVRIRRCACDNPPMSRGLSAWQPARRPAPRLAILLASVLLVAACGNPSPTAGPSGALSISPSATSSPNASAAPSADLTAVLATLEQDVQQI